MKIILEEYGPAIASTISMIMLVVIAMTTGSIFIDTLMKLVERI